jgi:dihydrofolate reductase
MRKLIYSINLSIDGCFEHMKLGPLAPDIELSQYYTRLVGEADLLVYGRKSYEIMVPYWPDIAKNPGGEDKEDVKFAEAFESRKKVVFSQTLDKAAGSNTTIVRGNLEEEILTLKQEQGDYMLVGGVDIASQLIAKGLIDEFWFVILPIFVGVGERLTERIGLPEKLHLRLVESKTFPSGCVELRYEKG